MKFFVLYGCLFVLYCTFPVSFGQPGRGHLTHTGAGAIPPASRRNPNFRPDGTGSPIYQYFRGYRGRIEFLEGIIKPDNIRRGGSHCTPATRRYTTQMSGTPPVPNDICGHIIANALGGPGNEEFNVYPQNTRLNNSPWKRFENDIRGFVSQNPNNAANLRFWFDYDSPTSTRPTSYTVVYNLLEGDIIEGNDVFRVENRAY